MEFISREKVCGRPLSENFNHKRRQAGGIGVKGPTFRPGPHGMFHSPPMRYSQAPFGCSNFIGSSPTSYGTNQPKLNFGKFPRNNFGRKFPPRSNEGPVAAIDLTRPWVTEIIKNEEAKKEELLNTWKFSSSDEDWSKYKTQKIKVQSMYENAKVEYIASHPNEAAYWANLPHLKKLYCETCDKPFRTDDDLVIHESEHETCGREGCEFTAHPKIIVKHIKMQHDSGLYNRIGKLYTEEDISKWIEERKKRYPTRKLMEKKKAMEEEKMNRGERIKEDNSRFNKSFNNRNKREVKSKFERKSKKRNRRQKKKIKKLPPAPLEEESVPVERKGVPAFHGIKDPKKSQPTEEETEEEKDNLNISDDEWETKPKNEFVKPILNNSLGLLAAVYDSNEENCDTEIVKKQEEKCISDSEGSGPEEVATVLRKSPPPKEANEKSVPQKRKKFDKNDRQNKRVKNYMNDRNSDSRSLTLLEKLLKDEIRHERNVILQCVHYVVKNNFFKT